MAKKRVTKTRFPKKKVPRKPKPDWKIIVKKEPVKPIEKQLEFNYLGEANVLQQFTINEGRKKVPVAGCRCTKGVLKKDALFRLIRNEDVLFDGRLDSLRHMKNEVDSIKTDLECGVRLSNPTIEILPGDKIVCYTMEEKAQPLDWDPGF